MARMLSIQKLPKQILQLADINNVAKQFEIQDGDFYFFAYANKPLGLPVRLFTIFSQISLFWCVLSISLNKDRRRG